MKDIPSDTSRLEQTFAGGEVLVERNDMLAGKKLGFGNEAKLLECKIFQSWDIFCRLYKCKTSCQKKRKKTNIFFSGTSNCLKEFQVFAGNCPAHIVGQ